MEDQFVTPYPYAVYRTCLNYSFLTICAQYLLCLIGVPLDPLISSYPHVVYTFYCTYRKIRIATIYIRRGMSKGILYVFLISQASEMTLENQYKSVKSVNGSLVTNGDNFFSFNFA